MRKLIAMAALVVALPTAGVAQDATQQKQSGRTTQGTLGWLITECAKFNATPEQVMKLEALAKQYETDTAKHREEMQKARQEIQGGADRQAVMEKMRPIRDEMMKKEEAAVEEALKLLSDEQKATVKQMIEARREEARNRRRGAGTGAR